jgi:Tfp pilus assembly protein PilO
VSRLRQWSLLTAVAVFAVLAAGWFLLVSPKRSDAAGLREQATAQARANDTLRAQAAALTLQARDLPRQRARLALLAGKIPSDPALPALIVRLREAADAAGVTLVSLAPGQPTAVAATRPGGVPAPTGSATAVGAGQLLAIPVIVQVTGGFFQLEQFLTNLEDLPRSFLVGQLSVAPGASVAATTTGQAGGLSSGSLTASLTGRVFLSAARPAGPTPVAPSTAGG